MNSPIKIFNSLIKAGLKRDHLLTITSARTIEAGKLIKLCFFSFSPAVQRSYLTIFCVSSSAFVHAVGRSSSLLFNRPFFSCALSILALSGNEATTSCKNLETLSRKHNLSYFQIAASHRSVRYNTDLPCPSDSKLFFQV